jgi:hypothetical protein
MERERDRWGERERERDIALWKIVMWLRPNFIQDLSLKNVMFTEIPLYEGHGVSLPCLRRPVIWCVSRFWQIFSHPWLWSLFLQTFINIVFNTVRDNKYWRIVLNITASEMILM